MKMPSWTREELILALQLYCKHDLNWLNKSSEDNVEIIQLSNIIRSLPIHSNNYKDNQSFRSPSSVHMKLMNFLRYDDQYGKKGLRVGLQNGSKLEQKIWNEFAKNTGMIDVHADIIFKKYSDKSYLQVKESFLDGNLDMEEILLPRIDEIITKIEYIRSNYSNRRKEAAFMESIDESQNVINEMYQRITKLNEWNEQINVIKKQISESKLSNQKNEVEEKVKEYTEIKIGKLVRTNLTNLILCEKLSSQDIEGLLDESWSRKTFHIGYPFLKIFKQNLSLSEQQKVNSYHRYWGQVFSYKGSNYLVCKEWFESNRKYFLAWISKFQLKTDDVVADQDEKQTEQK